MAKARARLAAKIARGMAPPARPPSRQLRAARNLATQPLPSCKESGGNGPAKRPCRRTSRSPTQRQPSMQQQPTWQRSRRQSHHSQHRGTQSSRNRARVALWLTLLWTLATSSWVTATTPGQVSWQACSQQQLVKGTTPKQPTQQLPSGWPKHYWQSALGNAISWSGIQHLHVWVGDERGPFWPAGHGAPHSLAAHEYRPREALERRSAECWQKAWGYHACTPSAATTGSGPIECSETVARGLPPMTCPWCSAPLAEPTSNRSVAPPRCPAAGQAAGRQGQRQRWRVLLHPYPQPRRQLGPPQPLSAAACARLPTAVEPERQACSSGSGSLAMAPLDAASAPSLFGQQGRPLVGIPQ